MVERPPFRAVRVLAERRHSPPLERGNDPEIQAPRAQEAFVFPDRCPAQPRVARSASTQQLFVVSFSLSPFLLFALLRSLRHLRGAGRSNKSWKSKLKSVDGEIAFIFA